MSTSTVPVAPIASVVGAAEVAENSPGFRADLASRATTSGRDWLDHIASAAGCTHPIRLAGTLTRVDKTTGEVVSNRSTADMPDGVIYTGCGNRRAIVCPSCAETYRGDAFQLVRTGMTGGKGIPASVAGHPAVFATFTAPGFGIVHTRRTSTSGKAIACRPRRKPEPCPHGIDIRCSRIHAQDEHRLGTPLCLDCYDHDAQVVWNHVAGELWRRTRIGIDRALAAICKRTGIDARSFKLRYTKVAEFQARGVIHFHAVLRLDGHMPGVPADPQLVLAPPAGLGVTELDAAIRHAVATTSFTTEPHTDQPEGWPTTWGKQLDIRPVKVASDGDLTDTAVAAYIAKYATKATEVCGHASSRLTQDTVDNFADPDGDHIQRLIAACWNLGTDPEWLGLRRWAHMIAFGGHFLTKARAYSLTFTRLRTDRIEWQRQQHHQADDAEGTTLLINWLTYTGTGWRTTADAILAESAAARAREHRAIAREEIACL